MVNEKGREGGELVGVAVLETVRSILCTYLKDSSHRID